MVQTVRGIAVKSNKISLPTRDADLSMIYSIDGELLACLEFLFARWTDGIGLASARRESDMPDKSDID